MGKCLCDFAETARVGDGSESSRTRYAASERGPSTIFHAVTYSSVCGCVCLFLGGGLGWGESAMPRARLPTQ